MGRLIVFSGAGLSAESGLATFRSADGLWSQHNLDTVCNFLTWKQNYDAVHAFYNQRRTDVGNAEPNVAHKIIAQWQQRYDTIILTQNVDNLLERAGCTQVTHLHGMIQEMQCTACGRVWNVGYAPWQADDRCACGSRKGVKPHVVFFNEMSANYRVLDVTMKQLQRDDVVVVSGTSGIVIPIDSYVYNRPAFKIFNDLYDAGSPKVYDASVTLPATQAFPLIDQMIAERLFPKRS